MRKKSRPQSGCPRCAELEKENKNLLNLSTNLKELRINGSSAFAEFAPGDLQMIVTHLMYDTFNAFMGVNGVQWSCEFQANPDYVEPRGEVRVDRPDLPEIGPLVVTIQRLHGKLPNQLRIEAEEALSAIRLRTEEYTRTLLFVRMSDISEEVYCTPWMFGLEYALWQMVEKAQGLAEFYGETTVTSEEINELRQLSEDAGGWMTYSTEPGTPTAKFVPMDEWLATYQEWRGK